MKALNISPYIFHFLVLTMGSTILLLRKRSIIETINDQLKNIFQLEHSRHRSLTNYMINIVACLVAYSYQDKKPALNLRREDLLPLLV